MNTLRHLISKNLRLTLSLTGAFLTLAVFFLIEVDQTDLSLTTQAQASVSTADDKDMSSPVTLYTCGMHPEVIQDHKGNCPKCGMKLVPMDKDRARMILEARGQVPADDDGSKDSNSGKSGKERKILYWQAPMDPTYIRNEPGKSPMGMDLVPVYADEVTGGPTIRIDPVTEQNMGVRYKAVQQGPLEKTVRTVGSVDFNEQGLGVVNTKTDGWVEKVFISETGTQVHAGDPLFEFYSPQLFSAQEEYLVALNDVQRSQGDTARRLALTRQQSARDRLRLYDITNDQIDQLEKTRKTSKTLIITAALTGIVTQLNVSEGDYLKAGQTAYRIADLSTVWVIGRVYESDLPFVKLGQEARMTLDYLPGRTWRGRVTYIYPFLKKGSREVDVRMEFHNPGYQLKPGMYATIHIDSHLKDNTILVPSSAIIDTGERQVAFVRSEQGQFQPRQLKLGLRGKNDQHEVLGGLAPGEMVVVSGQFLMDSESRLREATLKMLNPGLIKKQSVKNIDTTTDDDTPSTISTTPARYVCPMPSHAGILYDKSGDCPLCAMKLVPVDASYNAQIQKIEYYTCPMPEHFTVHESGPGKCPLCGMTLIPVTQDEVTRFEKSGGKTPTLHLYTCPMPSHAHVVSDKPGKCPECEMKLVPVEAVPHGAQAEEAWKALHTDKATSPTH